MRPAAGSARRPGAAAAAAPPRGSRTRPGRRGPRRSPRSAGSGRTWPTAHGGAGSPRATCPGWSAARWRAGGPRRGPRSRCPRRRGPGAASPRRPRPGCATRPAGQRPGPWWGRGTARWPGDPPAGRCRQRAGSPGTFPTPSPLPGPHGCRSQRARPPPPGVATAAVRRARRRRGSAQRGSRAARGPPPRGVRADAAHAAAVGEPPVGPGPQRARRRHQRGRCAGRPGCCRPPLSGRPNGRGCPRCGPRARPAR